MVKIHHSLAVDRGVHSEVDLELRVQGVEVLVSGDSLYYFKLRASENLHLLIQDTTILIVEAFRTGTGGGNQVLESQELQQSPPKEGFVGVIS